MAFSLINILISRQIWTNTTRKAKYLTPFLLFFLFSLSLSAQNWNQIIKVAASDRAAGNLFGYSVAISGEYAVVGAIFAKGDTVSTGSAYIFKRTGTTWVQEAKIVATDGSVGDRFGFAVAISGDYVIVGAHQEDEDAAGSNTKLGAGSAYIFKRTGTTWAQEAKIVAADRAAEDYFGSSVGISGDYAIVGAREEDEDKAGANRQDLAGSAYIFKRMGTTWAQETKIVAVDRAAEDYFGRSVGISGDYAVIGANREDEDAAGANTQSFAGSAYIFKRMGTTWAQETKIVAADRAAEDYFGTSVSISGDYVIVGAYGDDEDVAGTNTRGFAGSAYIFKRTGTTWAQEAKIVAADRAAENYFGVSVGISGDYAIVGAELEDHDVAGANSKNSAGAAYTFKRTGTTWAQEAKIVATDRAAGDYFGASVAVNSDYVIVGAYEEDEDAAGANTLSSAGSAYFFKRMLNVSVEESDNSNSKLKVYPNPVTNILTIETAENEPFQILNHLGQEVQRGKITAQGIDVSALPQGAYILKIGAAQAKFVKQ